MRRTQSKRGHREKEEETEQKRRTQSKRGGHKAKQEDRE